MLIGLAFGVSLPLLLLVSRLVPVWLGEDPPAPQLFTIDLLSRASLVPDMVLNRLSSGLLNGVLVSLIYVALRKLLRLRWLAGLALVLVFNLFIGAEGAFSGSPLPILLATAFSVLMLTPLLRFGLLSFIVASSTHQVLHFTPLTPNLGEWLSTPTLVACGALLLVAGYAYLQSRAGEPLLGFATED